MKNADLPCTPHYNNKKWEELHKLYRDTFLDRNDKINWIFRAEKRRKREDHREIKGNNKYNVKGCYFQTSLDKAFDIFKPNKTNRARLKLENRLLREFQRKVHHYLTYVPEFDNKIEWLTLMQHYEGPTRFLDWVYSFYVALFFALARLDCDKEYAEIWAVNARWIGEAEEKKFCTTPKLKKLLKLRKIDQIYINKYHNAILDKLFKHPKKQVFVLNSFRLNERLIAQQGTFLVQGNIDLSFDKNLKKMGKASELRKNLHRIVIDIRTSKRNEIIEDLNNMNINSAVLFPDLQGFAESLSSKLAYLGKV